ncbi:ABC transporter [Salinibacillus kushneri]|uniref:ABC transporter n=1 Tax=Salinibacillus kushneri TaxID=237682 RepID=A0A1H9Z6A2_9BACI|nr:ABC transporter [Salinibacillus kushneri]
MITLEIHSEQQKKIKKMKEAIKRLKDWANRANPPNAALHKRAKNMERSLEKMEKLQRPVLNRKKMNLEMDASDRSGNDVIMLSDVSKGFGDQLLFEQVNMHIKYQERAAIIGENGTGKSTLIKLILQQFIADEGEVRLGSNVKMGYLSQNVFYDIGDETVIGAFRKEVRVTEGEARHNLAGFMFYGYSVFQKVSHLSGGERMRLRLAQLMYQDINVLILDEPTNHLDIESREVLEDALGDFYGTILAVSHDRYFLNKLFHKIYWIEGKKIHGFEGDYNWAKEKMRELREKTAKESVEEKNRISEPSKPLVRNAREGNENLESKLLLLEENILELDEKLLNVEDLEAVQQLYKEKEELEKQWGELCDQLGNG